MDTIYINDQLEMMDHDLASNVNIYDLEIPDLLKNEGWRLPEPEEARTMLELHRKGLGAFRNEWYMTNMTASGFDNLEVHFGSGKEQNFDTTESHWGCCRVRLVRDRTPILGA